MLTKVVQSPSFDADRFHLREQNSLNVKKATVTCKLCGWWYGPQMAVALNMLKTITEITLDLLWVGQPVAL